MQVRKAEQTKRLQRNEQKWTRTLMEAGWTVLPSIILEKQDALGLDPIDVNILLQLARHWWYSDNPPHPSKATIAKCIGVDPSTVRRHIARMEADGFIRRESRFDKKYGQQTNVYRFEGLIAAATPHAKELIAMREEQRNAHAARRRRKKPRVTLVMDSSSKMTGAVQ
jgi:DNA-binding transcriptional ArsR family regulator